MTVSVEFPIGAEPGAVWDVLADVPRHAEWSPECVRMAWAPGWSGPAVDAEFTGHNSMDEWEWDITGFVTELSRPERVSWIVLGPPDVKEVPSSTWTYRLTPIDGGTLVTQTFVHGAGASYLRMFVRRQPDKVEKLITERAETLRGNMISTLTAMAEANGWACGTAVRTGG